MTQLRNLEALPDARHLHHWADYVELRCMADEDRAYSTAQLIRLVRQGDDLGEGHVARLDGETIGPGDLLEFMQDGVIEEEAELAPLPGEDPASRMDQDALHANNIFEQLRYRAGAFGPNYPFRLSNSSLIQVDERELNRGQEIYLYLLLCSSLRYIDKPAEHPLTTSFERFSLRSFRRCVPHDAEVHVFGTAGGKHSRYRGNVFNKITLLAQDLRLKLLVDEQEFSKRSTGDEGLDLVGWLDLPDRSKGIPVALGQCTVRKDWRGRQEDVSESRWGEIVHLSSPVQSMTFIPYCFHVNGGGWEVPHEVHKGVLIDRLRALHLLGDELAGPLDEVPLELVREVFDAACLVGGHPSNARERGWGWFVGLTLRAIRRLLTLVRQAWQ